MPFDFSRYLSTTDPKESYTIKRLSGGLINETVRATKLSRSPPQEGRFPGNKSLILKHAPPFMAALGDKFPFSQARQTVEATALSLFGAECGSLAQICRDAEISVPDVLLHDRESNVLVMTDLGPFPNLTDVLEDGIYSYLDTVSAAAVGCRLGSFFGKLHSSSTYNTAMAQSLEGVVSNESASRDLIFNFTVRPLVGYLQEYGAEDAGELARRVRDDFDQANDVAVQSFVLGDAWPGAILIGSQVYRDISLGVIDWEFAGFGRGVTGDIAQLLAHLHLHLLAASAGSQHAAAIISLVQSLTASYRTEAKRLGSSWATESLLESTVPNAATKAMRSAFLLVGREIVVNAIQLEIPCHCCRGAPTTCNAKRKEMVSTGIRYLQNATPSDVEFCGQVHLENVLKVESILKGLFID